MELITQNCTYPVPNYLKEHFSLEDILIFDIETTGFSPHNSQLYLIGCMYFEKGSPRIRQWFADTPAEEILILKEFFHFLKNYHYLLHFNGNGFDIPYLTQKAEAFQLQCSFSSLESVDLYKILSPFKTLLKLENLKQKTIENYLGIVREDLYHGGELISVYFQYLKSQDKESKKLLLLHNHDDICGLLQLMPLLSFRDITKEQICFLSAKISDYVSYEGETKKEAYFSFSLTSPLPKTVSFAKEDFYLTIQGKEGRLRVPVYTRELKFFYEDYKNYYYLPFEDTAVHKSVAQYVDKEYRQKAKAANCYSRKTDSFLPQFNQRISPCFQEDYKSKLFFFEANSDNLENSSAMKEYIWEILSFLMKKENTAKGKELP